ncbi:putative HMG box-containing protein C10F6.08c [Calycina marina]|uniref:HMG box-containing protein C10F6.08c n=1 Tax=Calycina marina TaxID=1763456 RepID=A0A9P7Z7I8_9HELO|nr:putative HMG box-containing protein C10F6.08c [Calycina marina]
MAPGAIPPPLAPSIEEAYRRKCIQLKQRMNEVEDANDASRVRLSRSQRAIEKLRLERAFLLEQLAKRTSTNVEDSEGSPSPPSTPKEKPLRIKRGHRRPSFLNTQGEGGGMGNASIQFPPTHSPRSDAFSHTQPDSNSLLASKPTGPDTRILPKSNGSHPYPSQPYITALHPTRQPKNAFELYCSEERDKVLARNAAAGADGPFNVEEALAIEFRSLDDKQRSRYEQTFSEYKSLQELRSPLAGRVEDQQGSAEQSRSADPPNTWAAREADADVEMNGPENDAGEETSGFTAVNRV